jgi:hypothetical protein
MCLAKHHAMNTYGGDGGIHLRILNVGNRWRYVVSSRSGRFTSKVRAHGTHWIGGWMCPRAGLDAVTKRKKNTIIDTAGKWTLLAQPVV